MLLPVPDGSPPVGAHSDLRPPDTDQAFSSTRLPPTVYFFFLSLVATMSFLNLQADEHGLASWSTSFLSLCQETGRCCLGRQNVSFLLWRRCPSVRQRLLIMLKTATEPLSAKMGQKLGCSLLGCFFLLPLFSFIFFLIKQIFL